MTARGLLVAIVLLVLGASPHGQIVIERVLARVDTSVIMLSDLRAAIGLGIVEAPAGPEGERVALDRLIDRQVLLHEVGRFTPPEPDEAAIAATVAAMKAHAGARLPEVLQTTGIDDGRIRELARDTLRIQAYIRQRFGAAATLADAEVTQWLRDTRKRTTIVEPAR